LSFERPGDWESEATSKTGAEAYQKEWSDFRDRRRVVSALLSGIDYLDNMGIIDAKRVGITGLSDGAETAASRLSTRRAIRCRCSKLYVVNPILFYVMGPKFEPLLEGLGMSDPSNDAAMAKWRAVSVALNAAKVRAPLLIHVSDSELLRRYSLRRLKAESKPVGDVRIPQRVSQQVAAGASNHIYRRTSNWFEYWLFGTIESDAVDARQYERWQALGPLRRSAEVSQRILCGQLSILADTIS